MSDTRPAAVPPPKPVGQAATPDAASAMTLFVMIVATLYFGKEVLVPVTLALLLAFILAPVVELLRRARLGRVPSVLVGVTLALGLVVATGGVIGSQLADLTRELPQYAETVEKKVSTVKDYTVGRLSQLADRIGTHSGSNAGNASAPSDYPATAQPAAAASPRRQQSEISARVGEPLPLPSALAFSNLWHCLCGRRLCTSSAGGSSGPPDPFDRFGGSPSDNACHRRRRPPS